MLLFDIDVFMDERDGNVCVGDSITVNRGCVEKREKDEK
jgi:hypothetical protein